ncbi:MAG: gamma-glutamyl-phosphate reductase, partial [Pseudomonadota bacterium]
MNDLSQANAENDIPAHMRAIGAAARAAARVLARTPTSQKNMALAAAADALIAQRAEILAANALDVARAQQTQDAAFVDRLKLNERAIEAMAEGLRQVAALADPIGETSAFDRRPTGIEVGRMRVPLGVIGMIYESRPNVTADAA